jgi:hypothetical protein
MTVMTRSARSKVLRPSITPRVHTLVCKRRTSSASLQDEMKALAESVEAELYAQLASRTEEKDGSGTELLLDCIRAGREFTLVRHHTRRILTE